MALAGSRRGETCAVRVLLLVNDSASSTTARTRVLIHTALSERHDTEVAFTNRRGHAARLARGAATTGTDAVVVLGGDGTLNEAANGVAGTECVLAALPGGSTNVFARTIGTPDDPLLATEAVLHAFDAGNITSAGLGRTSGRYFLFHCGMGLDAADGGTGRAAPDAQAISRPPAVPPRGPRDAAAPLRPADRNAGCPNAHDSGSGRPWTAASSSSWPTPTHTPFSAAVRFGSPPQRRCTPGSPWSALRSLGLADALGVLSAVFRANGSLGDTDPSVVQRIDDVRELTVTGTRPFGHQLDGDHLGAVDELQLEWVPDALRLAIPAAPR